MRQLLAKEMRGQWPMMVLIGCFITFTPVFHAFQRPLTLMGLDSVYDEYVFELNGEFLTIIFLFSMAVASGLMVREFDDSTIEFLDSLPVSRAQSFWVKWATGMFALLLIPCLVFFFSVLMLKVAKTSMETAIHWDWLCTAFGLQVVSIYFCLSVSMALSFLRRFGWLLAGVTLTTLLAMEQISPTFRLSHFLTYPEAQFDGLRWIIPWRVVLWQLVLGTFGLGLALMGYLSGGKRLLRWLGASSSRVKQVALAGVSALTVIAGFIALMIQTYNDPEFDEARDQDAVRVVYPSWQTSSRSTHHFDAVYPRNLDRRANRLLDDADAIYETVATFFDAPPPPDGARVQLDLNGASPYHLGTAYWQKLIMSLSSHPTHDDLRQTLGHEITHVVLEKLSDGELQQHFGSVRFFHEGVATYVERRFFAKPGSSPTRLVAAIEQSRGDIDMHLLFDNQQWCQEYDSFLVYNLGEVFAEAVVRKYGDNSLAKLTRAFADQANTEGLRGSPLWRSIFQAADMSLNEVIGECYRVLEAAAQEHAQTIRKFPDRHVLVDREGQALLFRLEPMDDSLSDPPAKMVNEPVDAGEPWELIVRFRPSIHSSDQDAWVRKIDEDSFVRVPISRFEGSMAWYMVGYQREGTLPIMGRWQKVTLQ